MGRHASAPPPYALPEGRGRARRGVYRARARASGEFGIQCATAPLGEAWSYLASFSGRLHGLTWVVPLFVLVAVGQCARMGAQGGRFDYAGTPVSILDWDFWHGPSSSWLSWERHTAFRFTLGGD